MTPPTEPGKPSLKERIEALAAMFDDTAQFEPRMNASLRAIAAELGEIAEEIEDFGLYCSPNGRAELGALAVRLAGKEGTKE